MCVRCSGGSQPPPLSDGLSIYIPCYPELAYEPHSSHYLTTRNGLPAALRSAPTWQNRLYAWSDSMQLRGGAGQAAAGRGEAEGALLHMADLTDPPMHQR